jgi:ABC-2 type transport system permease protein
MSEQAGGGPSTRTETAPPTGANTGTPAQQALLAVLVSGERPPAPNALSTSLTFGHRALLKIRHVPEQLFDVTLFPIIMTLLFTFIFGGALAGSVEDYIQFFMPGVIVQSVVMITMYTGTTLRNDIEKGVFDRFRSLPIWRPSALVGMLLGDTVRFLIASAVMVGVGLLLGWRPQGGAIGVLTGIGLLLVFAFGIGWIWTFISLLLRSSGAVMGVSMMVLMPLTFASNIFVSPETLPGWLEAFVGVNPLSHVVTAVRELMGGQEPGASGLIALLWAAGLTAVFGPLTMWRYRDAR